MSSITTGFLSALVKRIVGDSQVSRQSKPKRRRWPGRRTVESLEPRLPLASATIAGSVYDDLDADGLRDLGEQRLPGWTVYIDQNGNGNLDGGEPVQTTPSHGEYIFRNLAAGTYRIGQVELEGWRQTGPANSFYTVTVADGEDVAGLHFGNAQVFQVNGQTIDVFGTSGDDSFRFILNPVPKVSVNGALYVYDQAPVSVINFHGIGGNDSATLIGTSGDDHVDLYAGAADFSTPTVTVHTASVESTSVYSGGGSDTANMYDAASDDGFTARPTWARLSGNGFANYVNGFSQVDAYSTAGGDDRAYMHDSSGDDRYTSRPEWARLNGAGFSNYASGFGRVYAYATAGGANDRAYMYGSTAADRFYGRPEYGLMRGAQFEHYSYAAGFDRVYAYARSGFDYAYLYESVSDDSFYGRPDYSILRGNNYEFYNYANGFDRVFAYSGAGNDDDRAYLYDSPGDDILTGYPTWSRLRSSSFFNHAAGFDRVYAYATEGGTDDRAELHDGPTVDILVATPTYALLRGDSFEFYNYTNGFDRVDAFASLDGQSDRAMLYDSTNNDLFFGQAEVGYLTGNGFFNYASQFDEVTAISRDGGTDTLNVNSVDYLFQEIGNWSTPSGNTAPVAQTAQANVQEDAILTGSVTATDDDGDSLTFSRVDDAAHGTLTIQSNGTYTYTPNPNFHGVDSFTFQASDGTDSSNVATVSISVAPVNDAPVLSPIVDTAVQEGNVLTVTLSAADVDQGDTLTYSAAGPSFVGLSGNALTIAPAAGAAGTYSITVSVADRPLGDPQRLTDATSFTLDVTGSSVSLQPVSVVGNRFYSNGQPYFPTANFLRIDSPSAHLSHVYFSERISDSQRQANINTALADGSNSIYIYTINQGDYGSKFVTPYECPNNPCTQFVMGGNFDDAKLQSWRTELQGMIGQGLRPIIWLFPDDSPTIHQASNQELQRYISKMVQTFDDLPIVWVLGLEVNEYWSKSQSDSLGTYLQSLANNPVGIHQTSNRSDYMTSPWVEFGVYQYNFGLPWSTIYDRTVTANNLNKPLIAGEYDIDGGFLSQQRGLAAAFAGAAGTGNGAPSDLDEFMSQLPDNMTPSRNGNVLQLTGSGVTAVADMATLSFFIQTP